MIIRMNRTDYDVLAMSSSSSSFASSGLVDSQEQRHALDYLELGGAGSGHSAIATQLLANNITTTLLTTGINGSSGTMGGANDTDTKWPPLDATFIERFLMNRSIGYPWYHLLIAMYTVLICFGSFGNILVVIAVLRKPLMRTARNLFILNLAISDLLLCLVTMPLTLMEILSKFWPFGSCAILCKSIGLLQALSIYVSTISITAIAFDRYQVIVYPTRDSLQFVGAVSILAGIWMLALLLASPMFIYKRLINNETPMLLQQLGFQATLSFCIEDWPVAHGRFYYSIFSLCVQYLVPILIVSVAYFGIYNKLKNRITVVTVHQASSASSTQRKVERGRRMKRTNCLLISIAIIFGVSWLPLNFFNLYADMRRSAIVTEDMVVTYAICHMIGMSSACSNPLLYGWLNDNFRKEFQELLCSCTETTNVNALNGHTTGSSIQAAAARRRRKHNAGGGGGDISKGELKLLGGRDDAGGAANNTTRGGNGNGNGRANGDDCGGCGGGDAVDMVTTTNTNIYGGGYRSAVTESVALTENPMPTEITTLMPPPRPNAR